MHKILKVPEKYLDKFNSQLASMLANGHNEPEMTQAAKNYVELRNGKNIYYTDFLENYKKYIVNKPPEINNSKINATYIYNQICESIEIRIQRIMKSNAINRDDYINVDSYHSFNQKANGWIMTQKGHVFHKQKEELINKIDTLLLNTWNNYNVKKNGIVSMLRLVLSDLFWIGDNNDFMQVITQDFLILLTDTDNINNMMSTWQPDYSIMKKVGLC